MPSWIACQEGHRWNIRRREAASTLAIEGRLPNCTRRGCQAPRKYYVKHFYSNHMKDVEYVVEKVLKLPSSTDDPTGYHAFLFVLKDLETQGFSFWPYFWAQNKAGRWWNGQFPPIMSEKDMEMMVLAIRR